jgi:DNA-binding MarR family transcriptional regulator
VPKLTTASSLFNLAEQQAIDSNITAGLERLAQALRVLLWQAAKHHGLSPLQVQVLVYLKHHPAQDRRVSQLAESFDLSKATVSEAITALEQKGYLKRKPSMQDARVSFLELTASGRELADDLESWADTFKSQLVELDYDKRLELTHTLMALIGHLQEAGIITVARMCRTCRFFQTDVQNHEAGHYCKLLAKPLAQHELRLDCPDYERLSDIPPLSRRVS